MVLFPEFGLILGVVLSLPLLAALGAGYALAAWRAGRRGGSLGRPWAAATVATAAAGALWQVAGGSGWRYSAPVPAALTTFAFLLVIFGACYGAATVAVRRRLAGAPARGLQVAAAGAAAAGAAGAGCGAVLLAALRIAA